MENIKLRKFRALVNLIGLDDFGMSGSTFKVDQLIKGKVYIQADQRFYDARGRNSAPFFVDDNGCSNDITRAVEQGKVEEVFLTIIEEENPVFTRGDWVCKEEKTGIVVKVSFRAIHVKFDSDGYFEKFHFNSTHRQRTPITELKHFKWSINES